MTALEWESALGDSVTWRTGNEAAYRLVSLAGIEPVSLQTISRRSPGQIGTSLVDVLVPPRLLTVQGFLQASSRDALWPLRAALARALVTEPVLPDALDVYALGRLRIRERTGSPDLELLATPVSPHLPMPKSNVGILPHDVEFYAPSPYWRSLYESQLTFGSGEAGLEWPVEFPIEFESNNVEQEATNEGDVRAPVTMRIFGELENPKMTNERSGEVIEVLGTISAGDFLEITTEFGNKRVEYVESDGTRTNWMDHLNLASADFWHLLPGANLVRFEATVNTSGSALLLWRSQYSGI